MVGGEGRFGDGAVHGGNRTQLQMQAYFHTDTGTTTHMYVYVYMYAPHRHISLWTTFERVEKRRVDGKKQNNIEVSSVLHGPQSMTTPTIANF